MLRLSKVTTAVAAIIFSSYLYAAETYDSSRSYSGGEQVTAGGNLYEAKWWANPGQSPTDNYANEWDSPWKLVGEADSGSNSDPQTNPDQEPNPDPQPDLGDITPFIPGQTQVSNGEVVSYNGECFAAKNNPGVWETPRAGSWFWDVTECPADGTEPLDPLDTELSILSPIDGQQLTLDEMTTISAHVEGEATSRVEFWADNTKLGQQNTDQNNTLYSQEWVPKASGNSTLHITVYDQNNTIVAEQSVMVVVEATNDYVAPVVGFNAPSMGSVYKKDEVVTISVNASDADNDLSNVIVKADHQQICDFDATNNSENYSCSWQANNTGNVLLETVATDEQGLVSSATIQVTVNEADEPPPPPPPLGELCDEFNVYPNWTQDGFANKGDVMVHQNIAYSAKYWTQSPPGTDSSWQHELNCDGTSAGSAPLLSLPNPLDPLRLEVKGWPNKLIVAGPAMPAPATIHATTNLEELSDHDSLTQGFVEMIEVAEQAGSSSVIISSDVLDAITADKGKSVGTVAVKSALLEAVDKTGSQIDVDDINRLSNDAKGWTQAYNLILTTLAPQATFGWELSIGQFAYQPHSGRQSVWDSASVYSADLLATLELYTLGSGNKADFVAFTKSADTPELNGEQWHNALEYVKQVSDYIKAPAMLDNIPTQQAATYFLGNSGAERHVRKAAYSNVFAILFDDNSDNLTAKIEHYQQAPIPLYYDGEDVNAGPLTRIDALNQELIQAADVMNNEAFLYETPESQWVPSTVYKWEDFLDGLNAMHNIGVAGNKFWLIDENADDATNIKYAKVAIAAFLAQSMQETIRYNACDENNWSETRWGAPTDYPMSASCGQLDQKYADYGVNPVSGLDHAYSCPRDPKMEVSAMTHAKWYGAPAPVFAAPDAVLEERGLLVNGYAGRWTNSGHCNQVPDTVDTSKQVWERDECAVYEGQKAGSFIWDGSSQESVEGCGWWGRGVIQTTGRQNFGTLNHYMGRSHVDPDTIGQTIDGLTVEAPPKEPLYADLDFCSNPGLICSSEEHKEIKWIAGLFYWVTSVQAYPDESGQYGGWNYYQELKDYVDGGMVGTQFIDDVSGIVNRGCPDLTCSTGPVHNVEERRDNFKLVLQKLGLNPQ
ncbi:Ig-like domain-containing protein [Vibrio coralliilyticus]|uniref:Ig-like domain-containing protein n=1 Tax=Vibrio coralliilyticus TaxID=190893 RepID=UPI001E384A12|nr:Ig-like domain-containing protein [Vibrio coralliilyticus]MCC2525782.1 Ig-like domain-containing protein [Vibrio coralliilyticus]